MGGDYGGTIHPLIKVHTEEGSLAAYLTNSKPLPNRSPVGGSVGVGMA